MGKRIRGLQEYQDGVSKKKKRKRAHRLALEIRQFEIELYWKRAGYFWTIIAISFTGYFSLATSSETKRNPVLLFLISCLGLILSTSWYLVNRGSKYWQQNWERHVDCLEDEFVGPLYKRTIANEQFSFWHPLDGYPFSVSKVNQLISFFIAIIWLGLAISSFPPLHLPNCLISAGPSVLAVLTFCFLCLLFTKGRGGSQGKDREIDFYESDLVHLQRDDPSKK